MESQWEAPTSPFSKEWECSEGVTIPNSGPSRNPHIKLTVICSFHCHMGDVAYWHILVGKKMYDKVVRL